MLSTYFLKVYVQYSDSGIAQDSWAWRPIGIELLHLAMGSASGFNTCFTHQWVTSPHLQLWLLERQRPPEGAGVSWHFQVGPHSQTLLWKTPLLLSNREASGTGHYASPVTWDVESRSTLELTEHSKCGLSSLIISGVSKTTHTFSKFTRTHGTQYMIEFMDKVYTAMGYTIILARNKIHRWGLEKSTHRLPYACPLVRGYIKHTLS